SLAGYGRPWGRTLPFLPLSQVWFEVLNVEVILAVTPGPPRRPAGGSGLRGEQGGGVFVAMLGNDGLIGRERDGFVGDRYRLGCRAHQAHLNPVAFRDPQGLVAEGP